MDKPELIKDFYELSTGRNWCIGVMGFLRTLNEKVVTRRIYGEYDNDEPLSLIGVLALHDYDIHTREFVEFWRGSYNGLPECSLFYRQIDGNTVELKVVKRKEG